MSLCLEISDRVLMWVLPGPVLVEGKVDRVGKGARVQCGQDLSSLSTHPLWNISADNEEKGKQTLPKNPVVNWSICKTSGNVILEVPRHCPVSSLVSVRRGGQYCHVQGENKSKGRKIYAEEEWKAGCVIEVLLQAQLVIDPTFDETLHQADKNCLFQTVVAQIQEESHHHILVKVMLGKSEKESYIEWIPKNSLRLWSIRSTPSLTHRHDDPLIQWTSIIPMTTNPSSSSSSSSIPPK